jgi:SET family sugar efflux transporter-like MFS transporter
MATLFVSNLLTSEAQTWWVLFGLHLVDGAAMGAYAVASLAMMGDILDGNPRRARLVGVYRMSGSLAFSIAIVVAGTVAQRFGFPTTFKVAAVIYLVGFLISLALPERLGQKGGLVPRGEVRFGELLRGPMLPLLVVAASFSIPLSAVYSVWPIWVADDLGLGRAVFGQLWGLAAFVEVPCMAIAGLLVDRIGRRRTFVASLTVFASVYALYALVPTLSGLIVAQVIRGFAYAAFTATALTMAIEVSPPEGRGRAAGLFQTAQSLSSVAGSYSGGPFAQLFGFRALLGSAAGVALLGAAYVELALRRGPTREPRIGDPTNPDAAGD